MGKNRPAGKGNPVAKHMETFNRPATHLDKKKELRKGKQKHKKKGRTRRPLDLVMQHKSPSGAQVAI